MILPVFSSKCQYEHIIEDLLIVLVEHKLFNDYTQQKSLGCQWYSHIFEKQLAACVASEVFEQGMKCDSWTNDLSQQG